jgi:hypothetical protein
MQEESQVGFNELDPGSQGVRQLQLLTPAYQSEFIASLQQGLALKKVQSKWGQGICILELLGSFWP